MAYSTMQLDCGNGRSGILLLEDIIFKIGDEFNIRVPIDVANMNATPVLIGGLIGSLLLGRLGIAIGGCQMQTLRKAWPDIKEKVKGLLNLVSNFLRKHGTNILIAATIILKNRNDKEALAKEILFFLAKILGDKLISDLTDSKEE